MPSPYAAAVEAAMAAYLSTHANPCTNPSNALVLYFLRCDECCIGLTSSGIWWICCSQGSLHREARALREETTGGESTDTLVSGLHSAERGVRRHPHRIVNRKTATMVKGIGPRIAQVSRVRRRRGAAWASGRTGATLTRTAFRSPR